jgi:predicted dehydrogenase
MLKVGIIGEDNFHSKILGYLNSKECKIIAISNIINEQPHSILKKYNLEDSVKIFDNYDEMLTSQKFDIVDILLSPHSRSKTVMKCAKSGVTLISLETPIALDLRKAEKIIEECKRSNSTLVINNHTLFRPEIQKAKILMQSDYIGDLTSIRIKINLLGKDIFNKFDQREESNIKDEDNISENPFNYPILLELGSHALVLADWFCEEKIEKVFAWNGNFKQLDLPIYIMFKYSSKQNHVVPQYGNIEITYSPDIGSSQNDIDQFIEIIGTQGMIKINYSAFSENKLTDSEVLNPLIIVRDGKIEDYNHELNGLDASYLKSVKHLINVYKGNENPIISKNKARENLRITLSVIKSIKGKSEVDTL